MLRIHDDIGVAVQRSTALAYPLLVIIHDALPEQVNNTREATSSRTFSFLPSADDAYANASDTSHSFSAHDSTYSNSGSTMAHPSANASAEPVGTHATATTTAVAAAGGDGEHLGEEKKTEDGTAVDPQALPLNSPSGGAARFNRENAHLGKLKHSVDGPVTPDFALGELKGGLAQKEAITVALLNMRLGNVCLLHYIDAATPSYENFVKAMPSQQTTQQTPRVHVFPSTFFKQKEADMRAEGTAAAAGQGGSLPVFPFVLAGAELTPAALHHAVKTSLSLPLPELFALSGLARNFAGDRRYELLLGGASGGGGAAVADNAENPNAFVHMVGRMSAEAKRDSEAERSGREGLISRASAPPTAPSASGPKGSAGKAAPASAAAKQAAPAASVSGMHLIQIDQLPPHGTKRKSIVTNPSMTARTAWVEVEKLIDKARREVAEAKASGDWDGVECLLTKDNFYLELDPATTTTASHGNQAGSNEEAADAKPVIMRTLAEASAVRLQDYPSHSKIHVCQQGVPPATQAPPSSAASATVTHRADISASSKKKENTSEGKENEEEASTGAVVVCEGETCRRVSKGEAAEMESSKKQKVEEASTATTTTTTTPSPSTGDDKKNTEGSSGISHCHTDTTAKPSTITIRCALPDGRTETISDVHPSTDTLRSKLRPVITTSLNTSKFAFVCAFPPPARRFSVEGDDCDEAKPLAALKITSSCALRVVLTDAAPARNPSAGSAEANPASAFPVNPADVASASGIMAQFMRMLRSGAAGSDALPSAGSHVSSSGPAGRTLGGTPAGAAQHRPAGGGFRTMAEIRAAEENEEREGARQELMREQMRKLAQQAGHATGAASHQDPLASDAGSSSGGANQRGGPSREQLSAMEEFFRRFQQQQGDGGADTEGKKKKANHYFGGDSTEFISAPHGEADGDDGEEEEEEEERQGGRPGVQAFAGVGRRLADGQAVQHGAAGAPTAQEQQQQQQQQRQPSENEEGDHDDKAASASEKKNA